MCKRLWERREGEMEKSGGRARRGDVSLANVPSPYYIVETYKLTILCHGPLWEEEEAGEKKKHSVRQVL